MMNHLRLGSRFCWAKQNAHDFVLKVVGESKKGKSCGHYTAFRPFLQDYSKY